MSELTLTDADDLRLESFYDAGSKQVREDKLDIDRWSKYGHDRLYINAGIPKADKYGLYVDLEAHEIVSDNESKHSGGSVTIEGDKATIVIEESGDKEHEITLTLDGDGFEAAENDGDETRECEECGDEFDSAHGLSIHEGMVHSDDGSKEVAADGGEDTTGHVDDSTIENGIARHDDPDHPDSTTVNEVRDALAWVQQSIEAGWRDWLSNLENNECHVVHEDSDVIVFATGEQNVPRRDLREFYDGDLNERTPDVVSHVHHELARDRCDYDWGAEYPLVVRKNGEFDDGQRYVEALINSLQKHALSPGQAWAYYGVEIRGNSMNSWGQRKGDSDHKNVSDALGKARKKLPRA